MATVVLVSILILAVIGLVWFYTATVKEFREIVDELETTVDEQQEEIDNLTNKFLGEVVPKDVFDTSMKIMKEQISKLIDETNHLETTIVGKALEIELLTKRNEDLFGKQKSEQVRLGKVSENLVPLLEHFPYDRKNVRGLFNPVDLVVFEPDRIVFVEVKTGDSHLTATQKNIKRLIDNKQVYFETHRLNEKGYKVENG